jgi:hypothetical protein
MRGVGGSATNPDLQSWSIRRHSGSPCVSGSRAVRATYGSVATARMTPQDAHTAPKSRARSELLDPIPKSSPGPGDGLGEEVGRVGALWGSETPITLVTCGFARAGRCQIMGIAFLEGLNEVPAANPEPMRPESEGLKSCAEWLRTRAVKAVPSPRQPNRMANTRFPRIRRGSGRPRRPQRMRRSSP